VQASCSIDDGSSDWLMVQLPPLTTDAYEINFVFCDAAGTSYDNNDSNDFWLPVRQPEQLTPYTPGGSSNSGGFSRPSRSTGTVAAVAAAFAGDACGWLSPGKGLEAYAEALDAATAAAAKPADEAIAAATASCQYFFFSLPPVPVAGAKASLYVNKARLCSGLHEAGNLRLKVGFNKWQLLDQVGQLKLSILLVRCLYHICLTSLCGSVDGSVLMIPVAVKRLCSRLHQVVIVRLKGTSTSGSCWTRWGTK
jgi:hypothetical protein